MTNDIFLTAHAQKRAEQRGISVEEIRLVLDRPDLTMPGNEPGIKKYQRRLGKVICVVAVENSYPRKIITTYVIEEGAKG